MSDLKCDGTAGCPVCFPDYRPRWLANQCCDFCRALEGNGPWCCRCGSEHPEGSVGPDNWFTFDVCPECEEEMAMIARVEAAT